MAVKSTVLFLSNRHFKALGEFYCKKSAFDHNNKDVFFVFCEYVDDIKLITFVYHFENLVFKIVECHNSLLFYNQIVVISKCCALFVLICEHQMVMKGDGNMDNFYPRIRDLREDNDLTQEQVAEYLNMRQQQCSRYERGLSDIPTDVLIRLAKLYKTSTDYILGYSDKK